MPRRSARFFLLLDSAQRAAAAAHTRAPSASSVRPQPSVGFHPLLAARTHAQPHLTWIICCWSRFLCSGWHAPFNKSRSIPLLHSRRSEPTASDRVTRRHPTTQHRKVPVEYYRVFSLSEFADWSGRGSKFRSSAEHFISSIQNANSAERDSEARRGRCEHRIDCTQIVSI